MNLPTDLIHTPGNVGKINPSGHAKDFEKELKEIGKRVAPFNRAAKQPMANPFKEGDFIFIYQQQMEKTHKLSPRWRGPFSIIKTPNSFQVIYLDEGREKVTHIRHCNKFQEKIVPAKNESLPTVDITHEQKRRICQMKGHKLPRCCPRMTLCRFEVRFEGETYSFYDPGCFLLWLQDRGDVSKEDVFLRGVLAWGGEGSPEVTTFFRKELRLGPTLVRWQRRSIRYLRNRCGHQFCEEGAVCETLQLEFAGSRKRRSVDWNSPTCNVTEVMTMTLHHPVV